MEWLPPSTRETVGLLKEAIISAMASPASTSPPSVLSRIRIPSVSSSSSAWASFGRRCSYLVAFVLPDTASCPSISPMIVRSWIPKRDFPDPRSRDPVSLISSFSSFLCFCRSALTASSLCLFSAADCLFSINNYLLKCRQRCKYL